MLDRIQFVGLMVLIVGFFLTTAFYRRGFPSLFALVDGLVGYSTPLRFTIDTLTRSLVWLRWRLYNYRHRLLRLHTQIANEHANGHLADIDLVALSDELPGEWVATTHLELDSPLLTSASLRPSDTITIHHPDPRTSTRLLLTSIYDTTAWKGWVLYEVTSGGNVEQLEPGRHLCQSVSNRDRLTFDSAVEAVQAYIHRRIGA